MLLLGPLPADPCPAPAAPSGACLAQPAIARKRSPSTSTLASAPPCGGTGAAAAEAALASAPPPRRPQPLGIANCKAPLVIELQLEAGAALWPTWASASEHARRPRWPLIPPREPGTKSSNSGTLWELCLGAGGTSLCSCSSSGASSRSAQSRSNGDGAGVPETAASVRSTADGGGIQAGEGSPATTFMAARGVLTSPPPPLDTFSPPTALVSFTAPWACDSDLGARRVKEGPAVIARDTPSRKRAARPWGPTAHPVPQRPRDACRA
mmetsp:Transcript_121527/g.271532  ORF Transcript_121527/g.271532 Transcript_121527/m.271532 type:complete len:267 (+) Transcript_121527:348-1148(+)